MQHFLPKCESIHVLKVQLFDNQTSTNGSNFFQSRLTKFILTALIIYEGFLKNFKFWERTIYGYIKSFFFLYNYPTRFGYYREVCGILKLRLPVEKKCFSK